MKGILLKACLLLNVILLINMSANGQVIPEPVKTDLQGRYLTGVPAVPTYWNDLHVNDQDYVFSTCDDGKFYVGFQLAYDLGNKTTTTNWSAQVQVELILAGVSKWVKTLDIQMANQTFVSTIFHDKPISCTDHYEYKIKGLSSTGTVPTANVDLHLIFYKEHENDFDPGLGTTLTCTNTDSAKTALTWDIVPKASEYDVEWVFIDSLEGFTGDPFTKGTAGVTTAFNHYDHQTFYPGGNLWYRVRAVGYNAKYPEHRIVGQWSTCDVVHQVNQQLDITWQSQTVFTEDGKHKKVVKYLDPTLRERQSLINLSTSNTTLVGETMYDFEGRPAINVLPVPLGGLRGDRLTYRDALNNFTASNDVEDYVSDVLKKFHYDNGRFVNSTMDPESGASQYYSTGNAPQTMASNTLKNKYLPNANGYVYLQTEYLRDGRNLVSRQSGVGQAFDIDGTHATRYYYGQAAETELEALFGDNVGNAAHYKKHITVDNNGQVSVAYIDQEGRTIATALAGTPPPNLDALPSNKDSVITVDLSSKNKKDRSQSIIYHKILNEVQQTTYDFVASLSAMSFDAGVFGCQSCSYDLAITVTAPDGRPVDLALSPSETTKKYKRTGITSASCESATTIDDITFSFVAEEIGDYTVTKITTLVPMSYDSVKAAVMKSATVTTAISQLETSYANLPMSCATCTDPPYCPEAYAAIDDAIEESASMECRNIYNKLVDKWRETHNVDPTDTELSSTYPDSWCEYTLCTKNIQSDIFDKQMARIPTWSAAIAYGFDLSLERDPFFDSTAGLSGYLSKSDMRTRLNGIDIVQDGVLLFSGPIEKITDPAMREYYINADGTLDAVSGQHILYFDLMTNHASDPDYVQQLDTARWMMYRGFYQEQKRNQKLQISEYSSCPDAKATLEKFDLPSQEDEINDFFDTYGGVIPSPTGISDKELDALGFALKFRIKELCGITISSTDSSAIRGSLKTYFNHDFTNVRRLIYREDVENFNVDLDPIKTRIGQTCLLKLSEPIPFFCQLPYTSQIQNTDLLRGSEEGCDTTWNLNSGCFSGWDAITGTPNSSASGELLLWTVQCEAGSEAARGTFLTPLVPGRRYTLTFKYKAFVGSGYAGTFYNARLELSRDTRFIAANGEEVDIGSGESFSTFGSSLMSEESDSLSMSNALRTNSTNNMEPPIPCAQPGASYPDPVIIEGSTIPTDAIWVGGPASNTTYVQQSITFIPQEASTFFYVSISTNLPAPVQEAVVFDDFRLINRDQICHTATQNSYQVDWDAYRANCIANANDEKANLLEQAKNILIQRQMSIFYASSKCIDKLTEELNYTYSSQEYHHTLYYYDQAGNLVQTVPPNGVNTDSPANHSYLTNYKYNSYNQVIAQKTPDADSSRFWYNDKSQLRLSRNAQQKTKSKYSYSKYDPLGRVIEVGELTSSIQPPADTIENAAFPKQGVNTLSDITWTYYDSAATLIGSVFPQNNTRNRVSYTEVTDQSNAPGHSNNIKTYYSYDIHGNVKALRQDIPGLPTKTVNYVYDLVSNKVNFVFFQFGKTDQFAHRYQYDADNRLTSVSTSTDRFMWNLDAKYDYYDHGPLARVELGEHRVQAQDYFYTLQGWLKGVNMPYDGVDPGRDGKSPSLVGSDVTAFTLGYYSGDYSPIMGADSVNNNILGNNSSTLWSRWNSQYPPDGGGLYNGNISWMVTDLAKQGELKSDRYKGVQAMIYKYDQLNRITQSRSLAYNNTGFLAHPVGSASAYDETFSYDPNGNLQNLTRYSETGALKDNFAYKYYPGTNKLYEIHPNTQDLVITSGTITSNNIIYRNITISGTASVAAGSTVELRAINSIQMSPSFAAPLNSDFYAHLVTDGMYEYDSIGNLIADNEKGTQITWTPQGKVRQVNIQNGLSITTFRYDAVGNRVEKKVVASGVTKITRYLRDASGNVMTVYNDTTMIEQPIYGSSRVGLYVGGSQDGKSILNLRRYELTNHLGNVLGVISDKVSMNGTVMTATVLSTSDYYPFGLAMAGRTWSDPGLSYRYGFNGKEKDADTEWGNTEYDYGFRIYDPSIAKFLSVDPMTKEYPWYTPYQFAGNIPISKIDLDGLEPADPPAEWKLSDVKFHSGTGNAMSYTVENSNGLFKVYQHDLPDMKGQRYFYSNEGKLTFFRDDYLENRSRQLTAYAAVDVMEKGVMASAALVGGGSAFLEGYGEKVATGFVNDVFRQFASNYTLNGFDAQQAIDDIDYGNAFITGVTGSMNPFKGNKEILRKGLSELAKTTLDVTADGFRIKYAGKGDVDGISYFTELLTRQLLSFLPKVNDKEYIKTIEDIAKKTFRSAIQQTVESAFGNKGAENEGNIKHD